MVTNRMVWIVKVTSNPGLHVFSWMTIHARWYHFYVKSITLETASSTGQQRDNHLNIPDIKIIPYQYQNSAPSIDAFATFTES